MGEKEREADSWTAPGLLVGDGRAEGSEAEAPIGTLALLTRVRSAKTRPPGSFHYSGALLQCSKLPVRVGIWLLPLTTAESVKHFGSAVSVNL